MTTEDEERYATAARELFVKAQEALAQNDLRQAPGKGWGAAAQMFKAVATRRGWEHQSHAALFDVVRQLMLESGDTTFQVLFHGANSLHPNFYENWMQSEAIEVGLDQVEEFLHGLERLITDQS